MLPVPGSLRDFYANRFRPLRLLGSRPHTFEAYATALNHWERWHEATPLESIDAVTLASFAEKCLAFQGASTVNKTVRHLMAILRFAHREKRLAELPEWKKLAEPRRAPLAFTQEEFARILAVASQLEGTMLGVPASAWWEALLLTLWYTGARITALLAVTSSDYDRQAGGIYLRSERQKNRADQFLDLGDDALEAIDRIFCSQNIKLFRWKYSSDRPARKVFKRICQVAGVPLRTDTGSAFHRIRKSTASYLKIGGGNATARLGHSAASVTERYYDPRIVTEARQAQFLPRPR